MHVQVMEAFSEDTETDAQLILWPSVQSSLQLALNCFHYSQAESYSDATKQLYIN
jgi:hypothetical protein